MSFDQYFAQLPLIAILRGLQPDMAIDVGQALYDAGIRIMEVPLNSLRSLDSIARLAHCFSGKAIVGAGTITSALQCADVKAAGGQLVVSPNTDPEFIRAAIKNELAAIPGVATPSEAFCALKAGAHALKVFPAGSVGPGALSAWRAVLPPGIRLIAVGGVDTGNIPAWRTAGVDGFGIGSAVFAADFTPTNTKARATGFVGCLESFFTLAGITLAVSSEAGL